MNSSVFLKIFEYCLLPILTKTLTINSRQFGFRDNTDCVSAVCVLKEIILKYTNDNSFVHCAMLDLSQAFDKININKLVSKLRASETPKLVVDIIEYIYCNSYVRVAFGDSLSKEWKLGNGVRQGGILSPLLFNFYLNSMINEISKLRVGCQLNYSMFNIICYADDIVLLAPSRNGLKVLIDTAYLCLVKLGLRLNTSKSNYIVFRNPKSKSPQTSMEINGVDINKVFNCTYLGISISDDLNISSDLDRLLNTFLKQFNSFYGRFYFMNQQILNFLFATFTSSFYGIEISYNRDSCLTKLRRMAIAYHKCVKKIAHFNMWDSNHEACSLVGVPIFKHLMNKRLVLFLFRTINSNSPCLSNLSYFFRYKSFVSKFTKKLFFDEYSVDIFTNPICALLARVEYVERTGERSYYSYVPSL